MKHVALLFALAFPACATSTDGFTLGNAAWELVLSKTNGGILALTDKPPAPLTLGSRNGCFWGSTFKHPGPNPTYMGGCSYSATGSDRFTYSWTARSCASSTPPAGSTPLLQSCLRTR